MTNNIAKENSYLNEEKGVPLEQTSKKKGIELSRGPLFKNTDPSDASQNHNLQFPKCQRALRTQDRN